MPQLRLHSQHQEKGAHFSFDGDWELPLHYGDLSAEYRAVRETVGLADLSDGGHYLVTGKDRVPFLQNLASNDLSLLSEGKGLYTTLLTAKGRMLSDFYLYGLSDALFMEVDRMNAEKTVAHLMRYKLRSQIKIEAAPWGHFLVAGPGARSVLEGALGRTLPRMEEKSFFWAETNGAPLLCIKRSQTGEDDYHLYPSHESAENLFGKLLEAGAASGIRLIGRAALETLRVEAGKLRYGIDFDEHIIPVEAGLETEAISYTKGCYPGQEVIARIQTYGHVNKHLYGLVVEGEVLPKKDDKVFQADKELGWITSAVRSPFLGKIVAIGYLRPQIALPGTAVEIEANQTRIPAHATPLPFYRRA